jgi:ATP-dependent exoDNAse (exonuclease V) alpha subunit
MTQKEALAIMKTGVNVYLTGSAGSGKTYLLNQYIDYLKEHDIPVAVTASTGIAATHMHGMTIHGWAGIGVKEVLTKYDLEALEEKKYLWNRFQNSRVLIIDEVSMLHAHRLDMVDQVCRKFKRKDIPFGGLQVILSGDLFQLPPINKTGDANPKDMIMHSKVWQEMKPAICYLTEQHRQEDDSFLNILNAIRDDALEEEHFELLSSRHNASLGEGVNPTKLYTHNRNVDNENNLHLENIDSDSFSFDMTAKGKDIIVDILKKSCLAQEKLFLKKGAEVMFIKNNLEQGYVNGTRGIVENFNSEGLPIVRLLNGKKIEVGFENWAIEEDNKTKASICQIPLRLAWAITIHKSQGMSLDSAEIDLSNTFAYGMGYVALSRVKTLAGVRLVGFNPNALAVDPEVLSFDKKLREESEENKELFGKLKEEDQEKLENEFITKMGGTIKVTKKINSKTKKVQKIPSIEITKELLEKGLNIADIAKERELAQSTILGHVEEVVEKYPETVITHLRPAQKDIDIVKRAINSLPEDLKNKLTPIKSVLEKTGNKISFEEIRLARLFV